MTKSLVKKVIACKQCGGDFITQTTSVMYGTSWMNCSKCGFKSQDKNDFIKTVRVD